MKAFFETLLSKFNPIFNKETRLQNKLKAERYALIRGKLMEKQLKRKSR